MPATPHDLTELSARLFSNEADNNIPTIASARALPHGRYAFLNSAYAAPKTTPAFDSFQTHCRADDWGMKTRQQTAVDAFAEVLIGCDVAVPTHDLLMHASLRNNCWRTCRNHGDEPDKQLAFRPQSLYRMSRVTRIFAREVFQAQPFLRTAEIFHRPG